MIVERFLLGAMWAGVIALDFTALGPFMISQPLVAGPLFGYLMGNVAVGVVVGGIMQLMWMDLSPIGVGIPYDATSSTLLAVYWASAPGQGSLSQIVLCMALAIPCGYFFRWADQRARRVNTRIMHRLEAVRDEQLPLALWMGIGTGVVWSWVRYTVLYAIVFVLGDLFWKRLAYMPRLGPLDQGLILAIILLPVAGLGITLEIFLSGDDEGRWSSKKSVQNSKKDAS